ncbi:MAG: Y-family DNA polymerase [Bacteroidetes bacterium]|nr:Y-family DNA polymerase [Bacteroidota bacterium]MBS1975021.1 Y-family DNA polymerase [Bacteroidota bacterium]
MKAIVDCNSFYCSCERVFRPDLWNRPVVVLSNNDGCIVSRSDEAKRIGVKMAGPYFQAKHIIEKNDVAVFSSNYHLYGDMSMRVMDALRAMAGKENVEVYSVDEAFLDLDHIPFEHLEEFAQELKQVVEQWTGISVSVGVAPSKTLAKIANHIAKKEKEKTGCVTLLINDEQQRTALQQIRVNEIWGVGGAYADKLVNWGITSAWELRNMPEEWAQANMGGVAGARLIKELRGQPSIIMKKELEVKKRIATTRMFGRPVTELCELKEAIATYTSRAAEKLRRQHCAAKTISVFIVPRGDDHSTSFHHGPAISNCASLPSATSFTNELIGPALKLVDDIFERGKAYKKAGVMLSGLVPDDSIQGNFFCFPAKHTNRFLMSAVDNVNFSMRDDVVKFCSSGISKNWKMRQELRSKRHSTRWNELKVVS